MNTKHKEQILHNASTEEKIILTGRSDDDIAWLQRRAHIDLMAKRIAADLRQLADEVEQLDTQHRETLNKIRECIGIPRSVSFVS